MSSDSWSRSRSSASGGWGRRPPRGFAPAGSPRSASSPGAARKHSPWPWARPPPGTCAVARNRDPRPVRRGRRRGSFGSQSALGRARRSPAELDAVLVALVDRVTRRMQGSRRAGRTVTLRRASATSRERAAPALFPHVTDGTGAVLAAARMLLMAAMPLIERRGIALLGVAVSNLGGRGCGAQLELPLERAPDAALDAAVDEIRNRFGADAIRRAGTLHRDSAFTWLRPGEEPRS